MGDKFNWSYPSLFIYSTAVSCTYRAALRHPERFKREIPALVIRCARIGFKPYDTFRDRLRQALVAENNAIAAGELADGGKQDSGATVARSAKGYSIRHSAPKKTRSEANAPAKVVLDGKARVAKRGREYGKSSNLSTLHSPLRRGSRMRKSPDRLQ
jgi:hypothetical protein